MVAQSLGVSAIGMPICSDILESLYGIGKAHGTGEIKDANRIALRLPSYCGELSDDAAKMVMGVSVKQQQEIEKKIIFFNSATSEGAAESEHNHNSSYQREQPVFITIADAKSWRKQDI
ncbi:hypothetical protein [uncultured Desulfobacter sp.]|uniref:hypothetical protein n=1 Tax=uncultured Desulfobacter sp. TaxID=240139 RepID=UPI002AAB9628|nr:hypothetical protein [uncultured Desulfobacter sp.]